MNPDPEDETDPKDAEEDANDQPQAQPANIFKARSESLPGDD